MIHNIIWAGGFQDQSFPSKYKQQWEHLFRHSQRSMESCPYNIKGGFNYSFSKIFWIDQINLWLNNHHLIDYNPGFTLDMFPSDGSKPRWSFGAGDCAYVQDWQTQVWNGGSHLDPEIRHALISLPTVKLIECNTVTLFTRLICRKSKDMVPIKCHKFV